MKLPFRKIVALAAAFAFLSAVPAFAASASVDLYRATPDGPGEKIGVVTIEETLHGLVFTPDIKGLKPGGHGFHIHANADCGPSTDAKTGQVTPAGAAGGHLDPDKTNRHSYPWDDKGHLGDLPLLFVDAKGNASNPVLSPKLKSLDQVRNRALMIHEGSDNYADQPQALGGGGARMSCGVIR